MPKISAPTVAEHREQRRLALHQAATDLILRDGAFTVAEVAAHVGLSRSAVYEYYSCAADLIADVLVDELADWADVLSTATRDVTDTSVRSCATSPTAGTPWCARPARSTCPPPDGRRSAPGTAT